MLILLIYLYFITAMPVSKIWWFTRLSQPLWKTLKHQCHGRHYMAHPTNPVECCADANPKTMLPNDT